jgi:hypothetical protein
LNILKDFKVLSRFMQNSTQSPACSVYGLHRMLSSYWLAHFHLMKKSAKVQLYFGSVCGMMKFFYLRAAIQRTIDASPAFMEYGLAKKIAA